MCGRTLLCCYCMYTVLQCKIKQRFLIIFLICRLARASPWLLDRRSKAKVRPSNRKVASLDRKKPSSNKRSPSNRPSRLLRNQERWVVLLQVNSKLPQIITFLLSLFSILLLESAVMYSMHYAEVPLSLARISQVTFDFLVPARLQQFCSEYRAVQEYWQTFTVGIVHVGGWSRSNRH